MNTPEDIEKLNFAYSIIEDVSTRIDCKYCRKHAEYVLYLIKDITDITQFTLAYSNDQVALQKLRTILTEESSLRILAIASKFIGFLRRVKMKFKR